MKVINIEIDHAKLLNLIELIAPLASKTPIELGFKRESEYGSHVGEAVAAIIHFMMKHHEGVGKMFLMSFLSVLVNFGAEHGCTPVNADDMIPKTGLN